MQILNHYLLGDANMGHQLLKIVNDLVHNRGLRAQFNRDPEAFMERYELPEAERTALYTMDPFKIGEALGMELKGFQFDHDEFPPCQWNPAQEGPKINYPDPGPEAFAVEPPRRPAEDGVEVTVWGQSFPNDAQIVFDPPLRAPNQQRQGTYRCGQIVATLQSPPNETRTYTVTVKSERIGTIPSDQPIELELTEIATS